MSRRSSGGATACEPPDSRSNFSQNFENQLNEEMQKGPVIANVDTESVVLPTASIPGYARESVLVRGLQIPSRSKRVSSGFSYPIILEQYCVTKDDWSSFTNEVKKLAEMSTSQWLTVIGKSAVALAVGNAMVGFFGVIPAVVVGQKLRKKQEKQNLIAAEQNGALAECVKRWNDTYFLLRRLIVRVDVPGNTTDMAVMDMATSKSTTGQNTRGSNSVVFTPESSNTKITAYSNEQIEEMRARLKAVKRGRIVIIPMDSSALSALPEDQQSTGTTEAASIADVTMFGTSNQANLLP